MNFFRIFLVLLISLATTAANAEIILDEQAIEAGKIVVSVSGPDGYITARTCSKCPEMKLNINRATTVLVNGRLTTLNSTMNSHSWQGTVIFNPKNSTVRRLELYAKE